MLNSRFTLEICANGYSSALAAQLGGANRVELCDNLEEGGTTPSIGQVITCLKNLSIQIFPIIRPRGGNFVYSNQEMDIMLEDIEAFKKLKCAGIVIGILNEKHEIHKEYNQLLINAAGEMEVTFHRAFDRTPDLSKSLNTLMDLGIKRLLTSGGQNTALAGAHQIKSLIDQAKNKLEIMPGSGINIHNIEKIQALTNASIFHSTARNLNLIPEKQKINNTTNLSDSFLSTDKNTVKELVSILNNIQ